MAAIASTSSLTATRAATHTATTLTDYSAEAPTVAAAATRRHSYTATPAVTAGFYFPGSTEGSLASRADTVQQLFTRAIELLESNPSEAQKVFDHACRLLPLPTEAELKDASGSDRGIYVAVQKRAQEVKVMIQKALKDFAG